MERQVMAGMTAAAMLAVSGMALAGPPWRHAGTMGMRQYVVVDPAMSADAEMLRLAANEVCPPGRACVVVFWPEGAKVPGKGPMTQAQQRAAVAQYFRNPATGSEELLLKCQGDEPRAHKCLR